MTKLLPAELAEIVRATDRIARRHRAVFVVDPDKARDFNIAIERGRKRREGVRD